MAIYMPILQPSMRSHLTLLIGWEAYEVRLSLFLRLTTNTANKMHDKATTDVRNMALGMGISMPPCFGFMLLFELPIGDLELYLSFIGLVFVMVMGGVWLGRRLNEKVLIVGGAAGWFLMSSYLLYKLL